MQTRLRAQRLYERRLLSISLSSLFCDTWAVWLSLPGTYAGMYQPKIFRPCLLFACRSWLEKIFFIFYKGCHIIFSMRNAHLIRMFSERKKSPHIQEKEEGCSLSDSNEIRTCMIHSIQVTIYPSARVLGSCVTRFLSLSLGHYENRDFRWTLRFLSSFLAFWAGGSVSWLVSCPQFLKGAEGRGGCHDVCKSKITQTYAIKMSALM